jgi:predicted transcriptional regulator
MKRAKSLEIRFQSVQDFRTEVRAALRDRKRGTQLEHRIYFDSVPTYRKFMTSQKIELLTAIVLHSPGSIYELAQLVQRDFAAVQRDCVALEGAGFIRLKEANDAREARIPELVFPYRKIRVMIPASPYQIEIAEAEEVA